MNRTPASVPATTSAEVAPSSPPTELLAGLPFTCIKQYFATLNAGDFTATAALFAEDGVLFPPFEDGILGQAAIANYLQTEASGMQLVPHSAGLCPDDDSDAAAPTTGQTLEVKGMVKTPLFGVPVRWIFVVDAGDRIRSVGIQLLASLAELLQFKPEAANQRNR